VLAAGAAAIVVLLVVWAAWPAWRLASAGARVSGTPAAPGPQLRLTAWLAGAGLPVTAAAGVRLALEPGRGRTAAPVRSALAGTALSVLAVTAALTFGANLLHLVNTPRLYGQRWDAAIELQFSFAELTAKHLSNLNQQSVTDLVAIVVIDLFESIQIHIQQGQLLIEFCGVRNLLLAMCVECPGVQQPCEQVGHRGRLRLFIDDRVVDRQQRAVLLQRVVNTGEGPLAVLSAVRCLAKPVRLGLPAILHVLPPS